MPATLGDAEIPPDLEPLHRALANCGVDASLIPQTAERLIRPPFSFQISASDNDHTKLALADLGHDRDVAARILCVNEGRPNPDATWKGLTRPERKRAQRLTGWALGPDELGVTPQGRPPEIDSALVVYCARVLCEACGKPRFKFARPSVEDALGGPMWRALIAALPSAFSFSTTSVCPQTIPSREVGRHSETIAEIVKVTRSKLFNRWCTEFGLGPHSDDVARHPAMFRVVVRLARRRG